MDNAFGRIADFAQANHMAATWEMEALHQRLDALARQYCPVVAQFGLSYHWSIMQAEYATDIVFKNHTTLQTPSPSGCTTTSGRTWH